MTDTAPGSYPGGNRLAVADIPDTSFFLVVNKQQFSVVAEGNAVKIPIGNFVNPAGRCAVVNTGRETFILDALSCSNEQQLVAPGVHGSLGKLLEIKRASIQFQVARLEHS